MKRGMIRMFAAAVAFAATVLLCAGAWAGEGQEVAGTPLCFTAEAPNSSVTLNASPALSPKFKYSVNGSAYQDYTSGTEITLANVGDKVCFCAKYVGTQRISNGTASGQYTYFSMSGKVAASGDVTSLLNILGTTTLSDYAFNYLFGDCAALTAAPALPATTLAGICYYGMFADCTALTAAPALPATTLAQYCYCEMFSGCTALKVYSAAQPGLVEWSIPAGAVAANEWNTDMFAGTGGDFTGDPVIGTVYYVLAPVESDEVGDPLCFTAEAPNSSVTLNVCSDLAPEFKYSKNGSAYQDYTSGTEIALANVGDKVCFRAKNASTQRISKGDGIGEYTQFSMSGRIAASGDVTTLLNPLGTDTLPDFAFLYLFEDCVALTAAPELPATTLADSCYSYMFYGCTSLTAAPALPATTLAFRCYCFMFCDCRALRVCAAAQSGGTEWSIPAGAVAASEWNKHMFNGTGGDFTDDPVIGTVYYVLAPVESDEVGDPLCFTAEAPNSSVTLNVCSDFSPEFKYSVNGSAYQDYTSGTKITLANMGDKVCFRAKYVGTQRISNGSASGEYTQFSMSGRIAASGDVTTLLNPLGTDTLPDFAFLYLFEDCAALTAAPALPATTLAESCYEGMFCGCTSLTAAPALPATTLADHCYGFMFYDCTALRFYAAAQPGGTEWSIPAGAVAASEWNAGMFAGTGGDFTDDPVIGTVYYVLAPVESEEVGDPLCFTAETPNSSVTLDASPFLSPEFKYSVNGSAYQDYPSGTEIVLANAGDKVCFRAKYVGTQRISVSDFDPEDFLPYTHFSMSGRIAASGDVTTLLNPLGTDMLPDMAFWGLFEGCVALTAAPALPATTLAEGCYCRMFYGCTSLTAAPALPATTLAPGCYYCMFYGCTSLTAVPALPATMLALDCYLGMFCDCTALKVYSTAQPGLVEWSIPAEAVGDNDWYWYIGMFAGTGGDFTDDPVIGTVYYVLPSAAPLYTEEGEVNPQSGRYVPPELFAEKAAVDFAGNTTYNGWLRGADGSLLGVLNVKAAKAGRDGKSKLTITYTPFGGKKQKIKLNRDAMPEVGGRPVVDLPGVGRVKFGADSLAGEGLDVQAGPDFSKDRERKAAYNARLAGLVGTWTFAFNTDLGYAAFSVTVDKKGKGKLAGTLPDGTKVSVSSQGTLGDGALAIPFAYSKKGKFAFVFWVNADRTAQLSDVTTLKLANDREPAVRSWTVPNRAFALADGARTLHVGAIAQAFTVAGKKWTFPKHDKRAGDADPNPYSAKLSYTPKTGVVKGSLSIVDPATGKAVKYTVNGVVVDGRLCGAASAKGREPMKATAR